MVQPIIPKRSSTKRIHLQIGGWTFQQRFSLTSPPCLRNIKKTILKCWEIVSHIFNAISTFTKFQTRVFPNGLYYSLFLFQQIPTKYARSLQYTIDTISNGSPGKPFLHLRPEYSLIQPKDPIRLKALKFTSTYWHTVSLDLDMIEYISLLSKPWFCTNTKSVYFFSLNSHPSSHVAASSKKIRGAPWWLVNIYRG